MLFKTWKKRPGTSIEKSKDEKPGFLDGLKIKHDNNREVYFMVTSDFGLTKNGERSLFGWWFTLKTKPSLALANENIKITEDRMAEWKVLENMND